MKLTNRLAWFLSLWLLGGFFPLQTEPAQAQTLPSQKAQPVILEFSRTQCPMCEFMEKTLAQLKAQYVGQINVQVLHWDPDEKLFKQYQVVFVPTQVFLDASGKEVFRHTGIYTLHELVQKLQELKLIQAP